MYEIPKPRTDEPELVIAELLGKINMLSNSRKRLQSIIRSYETIASGYDVKAAALRDERDRARALAATLEAECANCWGPVHTHTLRRMRQEAGYVS